jgi:hypothetical protein
LSQSLLYFSRVFSAPRVLNMSEVPKFKDINYMSP